jgi:hypothetical protein
VCVVNPSNYPVSGILVRESYQNYSAESEGYEENMYTNAQGCVHFPAKRTRASALRRAAAILASATGGGHASFGPYSYVTAFSEGNRGDDIRGGYEYAWQGSPVQERSILILRK